METMNPILVLLMALAVMVVAAFILLYPFHLADKKPDQYRGLWASIGRLIKNRYSALLILNTFSGINIANVVWAYEQGFLSGMIAMLIYFLIITPTFLWYPFYLKERRPDRFKGIWRRIGEWIGDPRAASTSRRI